MANPVPEARVYYGLVNWYEWIEVTDVVTTRVETAKDKTTPETSYRGSDQQEDNIELSPPPDRGVVAGSPIALHEDYTNAACHKKQMMDDQAQKQVPEALSGIIGPAETLSLHGPALWAFPHFVFRQEVVLVRGKDGSNIGP